ncbi:MAG TPA: hypothetical protein VFC00_16855 [Micromonosporaceae bacterium]|nr:hypothetical protein [Micromonosporaceae bacterium]
MALHAGFSAKTDFDPAGIEPTPIRQHVLDALGAIGCRSRVPSCAPARRPDCRHRSYRPSPSTPRCPRGSRSGPHIPQLVFSFAVGADGMTVADGLAGRPGNADLHGIAAFGRHVAVRLGGATALGTSGRAPPRTVNW